MRRRVVAPLSGVIDNLQVHTPGGVVKSGEPLLDIVPKDDRLIVEARVTPDDVDVVKVGVDAQVRLTAYSARETFLLDGKVTHVSADRAVDKRTGEPYYVAHVEVPPSALARQKNVRLQAGMAAEVMIRIGARTAGEYLLEPITRSFRRAFREE